VLGLLGWLWLFILTVKRLAKRAKIERDVPEGFLPVALAASIAGFAVSMWFYDAFTFTQGNFLLHLLIAFSAVLLLQPAVTKASSGARAGARAGARGGAPRVPVEV
jgi:hypothetical protein